MRARPAALATALIAVAVVGAGCGGDDDQPAAGTSSTTPAITPTTPINAAPSAGANGSGAAGTTPGTTGAPTTKDTIAEQIAKNPDLRTLSTAVNAAGLASALESGRYTVFAPNNDAFTKLGTQLDTLLQPGGKAQLANILKFHVVKGRYTARRLKDGKLLTTLQGTRLRVSVKDGIVSVGNGLGKATVLVADARAANGVIHTIDTVLRPKTTN